ncbi:hypothetical protein [Actinomadura sp. DC4]|nr:hypothetical protein [Actinomadura sp. DC4]MDN3353452.1 hypothetical protein [Actinomadura sp. DC4]
MLDAGCGTGENALHAAALGVPVPGFDGGGVRTAPRPATIERRA